MLHQKIDVNERKGICETIFRFSSNLALIDQNEAANILFE
jgi:hypothetical protein